MFLSLNETELTEEGSFLKGLLKVLDFTVCQGSPVRRLRITGILPIIQQCRDEDKIPSEENIWLGFRVSSKRLNHLHLRGNLYVSFKAWEPLSQYNIW